MLNEFNSKNFPKTLGNWFHQYLIKNQACQNNKNGKPLEGIKNFIEKGTEEQPTEKNGKKKQKSYQLEDFQKLCRDYDSRVVFKNFLLEEFILYLIQSGKVVDPTQYVDQICVYFCTANQPENMICNKAKFDKSK